MSLRMDVRHVNAMHAHGQEDLNRANINGRENKVIPSTSARFKL